MSAASGSANGYPRSYFRFAVAFLGYTLFVILWGALVRATGSGAGCGSHWPLCNAQVVPLEPTLETIIEFTHRVTSGFALIGAIALPLWARKVFPAGHRAIRASWWALLFMVTEALVGAGIVLFEMVAYDTRLARGYWMAAHLINTFLLIAAQSLAVWWARFGTGEARGRDPRVWWLVSAGVAGMLLLGVSGAIAALGDTLFPAGSLAEGVAADFSPDAHVFLRLRIFHPLIAVVVACYFLVAANLLADMQSGVLVRRMARLATGLFIAQLAVGALNLLLLAPVWMQLVHLLLADFVWMAFVVLCAESLLPREAPVSQPAMELSPSA